MRDLNYQLKELCRKNRDGSYATQAQRLALLTLMANQLHELGYRQMEAQSLKPKHVEALVKHWLSADLAIATMKNRRRCAGGPRRSGGRTSSRGAMTITAFRSVSS